MYLFNMPKKIKKTFSVTDEQQKAMVWCIRNDIRVGILPTKKGLKIE